MPILERDIRRTVDLDKEIKASGYFDDADREMLDRVGQELLDAVNVDDEEQKSPDEFQDESQFEVDDD